MVKSDSSWCRGQTCRPVPGRHRSPAIVTPPIATSRHRVPQRERPVWLEIGYPAYKALAVSFETVSSVDFVRQHRCRCRGALSRESQRCNDGRATGNTRNGKAVQEQLTAAGPDSAQGGRYAQAQPSALNTKPCTFNSSFPYAPATRRSGRCDGQRNPREAGVRVPA